MQWTKPANAENDVELVKKSIDKNGVRRVTGTKKVKESQEYPAGFGHAVADHFLTSFSEAHVMADFMAECDPDETDEETDFWEDALNGHTILELLTVAKNFRTPTP